MEATQIITNSFNMSQDTSMSLNGHILNVLLDGTDAHNTTQHEKHTHV